MKNIFERLKYPGSGLCTEDPNDYAFSMSVAEAIQVRDRIKELEEKLDSVSQIVLDYGGIDGGHHKQRALDNIIRTIEGDDYEEWVRNWEDGEDGPQTYTWDTGIAR